MGLAGLRQIGLIAATAVLAACGGPPDNPLQHSARIVPASEQAQGPKIPKDDLAPVRLAQVNLGIPSGVSIGTWQFSLFRCGNFGRPDITLKTAEGPVYERAFLGAFHASLSKAEYNVIGGTSKMFRRKDEKAAYLVGAEITGIQLSMCDRMRPFPFHRYRMGAEDGNGSISVDWQVYSTMTRTVVYRTTTDGFATLKNPVPNGYRVLIHRTFRAAAERLADDPKFRAAVKRRPARMAARAGATAPAVTVPRVRPFVGPFGDNAPKVVGSTVTLDVGESHGSGFFITRRGLLLTNQHVVGDAKTVRVRLYGGTALRGRVLRRDAVRDVALVLVDAEGTRALPLRSKPVSVGEEVYAIGTPLYRELSATVTKGIVSAIRRYGRNELPMIQADVDVHGGSSGGPLVDRHGNVVGITVLGKGMNPGKKSIGLNFFIPIADALKRLNIRIEPRRGRPGA